MTADIQVVEDDGVTVAQLEALQEARAERDDAILRAEQAERESGSLRELAEWLVSMDDPDDSAGLYARRSVTLTAIIKRATDALATKFPLGQTLTEVKRQREQARNIAALLESEVAEKDRRIAAAYALAERLPCSPPPLSCRRCDILRALQGES